MIKAHTYDYIKNYVNNLGFNLLSENYKNNNQKLILEDDNGYLYYVRFMSILQGITNSKFHKSNPYTIYNIKLWLNINNIDLELISNTYKGSDQYLILKTIEGYLCISKWDSLHQHDIPKIFSKLNPYTVQNIKLWCKINNKPFELLSDKYLRNNKKLKWKCLKDDCNEEFESSWNSILDGRGCGYCAGQLVGVSNCLATKRPDLIEEWHPTLNGELTPYDITVSSGKYVWWQCSKNPKHFWKTKVSARTNSNCGCPYCAGFYPSEDYNLLVINPEICKDWDYIKNNRKPEEYTPNTKEKVWWKCKECGYEWKTSIDSRNGCDKKPGTGCPECNKSKGEKRISNYLINNNYIIISKKYFNMSNNNINKLCVPQKEFDDLIGLGGGLLSYDFYLPNNNLLIEYQGKQHEKFVKGIHKTKKDFEKQVEHDRRKKEYARIHNIKLLEIWYYDFDRIEEILEANINNIKLLS